MFINIGELAAFATAVSWSFSNQVNSAVGRIVGASSLTLLRLPYMIAFVGIICLILRPDLSIDPIAIPYLVTSGVLGVVLCDFLLYSSILIIGPTMGMLILSLSAGITAIISWVFLGETLPLQAIAGIIIAIGGIAWVISEEGDSILLPGQEIPRGKALALGVILAFGAALCLAGGYTAQRVAMQTGVNALWATFIRISGGAVCLWSFGLFNGWSKKAVKGLLDNRKVRFMLFFSSGCGALGMWFSSVALSLTPAGIVATITGIQPILVALIGAFWYRRMPSFRFFVGSALAFSGIALVCLR